MQHIVKYENLQELVPELLQVLQESIQDDLLEIRRINRLAEKFEAVLERFPELQDATYVIYSKYVRKCDHEHETFVFVTEQGSPITYIHGRDLTVHGIIKPCEEFAITVEYVSSHTS
jgi:hypothetical protein